MANNRSPGAAEDVLAHIGDGADLIVPLAGPQPLQRGAEAAAGDDPVLDGAGRGGADG